MLQQVAIYVAGDDDPESNNGGSATAEEWAIDYFKSISKTVYGDSVLGYLSNRKHFKKDFPYLSEDDITDITEWAHTHIKPHTVKAVRKTRSNARPPCPPSQIRNRTTKACRDKKPRGRTARAPCSSSQIRNRTTKACRDKKKPGRKPKAA